MASSLNKLVYDIKNTGSGGFQSDDTPVSDRQVAFWINQERAFFISQLFSAGKAIPDALVQHLECVEMECLDPAECCEIQTCDRVLRSTQKIPQTIHRNDRDSILTVSTPDHRMGFTKTSYFRQRTNQYNKYTGKKPRYFIKNNYLYVTNTTELEYVALSGIFDDPTEALLFSNCDGTPCWTWDDEYPITNRLSTIISGKILKERLGISLSSPNDENNDARQQPSNEKD